MSGPFDTEFPTFAELVRDEAAMLEELLPPASPSEIDELEAGLGTALPTSYKRFLRCSRGLWLFGGALQMSKGHPFFHDYPEYEALTPAQRQVVAQRGGKWPPPSSGMLCFAEFFLEADGDQVLFNVNEGLHDGEYPIVYYAHEIPATRVIAASFTEWLNRLPSYFEGSLPLLSEDL